MVRQIMVGKLSLTQLFLFLATFSLIALTLSGCGLIFGSESERPRIASDVSIRFDSDEVSSGIIMIGGPAPEPNPALIGNSLRNALAFDVSSSLSVPSWLEIDRITSLVRLKQGDQTIQEVAAKFPVALAAGQYSVIHKQRNPLWYANTEYFNRRGLAVPAEGSRDRFLRGALGDFAIFMQEAAAQNQSTADDEHKPMTQIHCGPAWSEELGGAQIEGTVMAKLYNALEIGSAVIVR